MIGLSGTGVVIDDELGAEGGEVDGDGFADAARAAGDDCDAVLEWRRLGGGGGGGFGGHRYV